jgi:hypothetical protein
MTASFSLSSRVDVTNLYAGADRMLDMGCGEAMKERSGAMTSLGTASGVPSEAMCCGGGVTSGGARWAPGHNNHQKACHQETSPDLKAKVGGRTWDRERG